MKGTYWYAVDYAGTGHLFTYKPERDAGIWNGEEAPIDKTSKPLP